MKNLGLCNSFIKIKIKKISLKEIIIWFQKSLYKIPIDNTEFLDYKWNHLTVATYIYVIKNYRVIKKENHIQQYQSFMGINMGIYFINQ